jgi:hypothetical protein
MAAVTGSGYPDEETFSRRGSAAGKFQQAGGQQFDVGKMYQDLMNRLTGRGGPQVTGDIGEVNPAVTYGGGGRGSMQGATRTTMGRGGGQNLPSGRTGFMQSPALAGNIQTSLGIGATALGLAPGAIQTAQTQGLGAATASTAAGLGTAALVSPLSRGLMAAPNPLLKAAGFGLQALAPGLAQAGVAGMFDKAEDASKRPGAGPDVTIPGTNIPLTETAAARQQIEFAGEMRRQQTLKDLTTLGPAEIAQTKEAIQMMNEMELQREKALMPLREQMMRTQLVNTQAINASNASLAQQMGRTATMGAMAQQGQIEAGATTRTLLSQNPYAGAILQAPSISFG